MHRLRCEAFTRREIKMEKFHGMERSLILECLKVPVGFGVAYKIEYLIKELGKLSKNRNLQFEREIPAWEEDGGSWTLHQNLILPVYDAVWDLIAEGVLRPGSEKYTELPYIHLTEHGRRVLAEDFGPHDPEGYIKHLKSLVPMIDGTIERYVVEAVANFRSHSYLSASVMLGCASEKLFLLLLDSYCNHLPAADRSTFEAKLRKVRWMGAMHGVFMKQFHDVLSHELLPIEGKEWISERADALQFVLEHFRKNRNEAGHPTGQALSKDIIFGHLLMFPAYCRSVYLLIDWLVARPG